MVIKILLKRCSNFYFVCFDMRNYKNYFLLILFVTSFLSFKEALAAGKTYIGKESSAHCTLWSNKRLKWPQTSHGKEKAECRRRGVTSSQGTTFCRLIRNFIDGESGERMCVYKRQGTGLTELTVSTSPKLKCQPEFMCNRE